KILIYSDIFKKLLLFNSEFQKIFEFKWLDEIIIDLQWSSSLSIFFISTHHSILTLDPIKIYFLKLNKIKPIHWSNIIKSITCNKDYLFVHYDGCSEKYQFIERWNLITGKIEKRWNHYQLFFDNYSLNGYKNRISRLDLNGYLMIINVLNKQTGSWLKLVDCDLNFIRDIHLRVNTLTSLPIFEDKWIGYCRLTNKSYLIHANDDGEECQVITVNDGQIFHKYNNFLINMNFFGKNNQYFLIANQYDLKLYQFA
ncbi:unnamed protein product, partial [Didymodactylos carnosus]